MTARPCLGCGQITQATRCTDCAALRSQRVEIRRGTSRDRGYDSRWDRLSRRARRMQPFCTDCGTTENLTADHLRWPARTLADVEVCCLDCNIKRGAARGDNVRTDPREGYRRKGLRTLGPDKMSVTENDSQQQEVVR